MAIFPSVQSILLEVHQSLGCPTKYQTKEKHAFAERKQQGETHYKMLRDILDEICDAVLLEGSERQDPKVRQDIQECIFKFMAGYRFLENRVYTFTATEQQVVWHLLARSIIPYLARTVAFWTMGAVPDKGMPGGEFWYLPSLSSDDLDVPDLSKPVKLPVQQVCDWLLDLLGGPMDHLVDDGDPRNPEGLIRSLQNWRKGTLPSIKAIRDYFPDHARIRFEGTFPPPSEMMEGVVFESLCLSDQFEEALSFVKKKGLDSSSLRYQIPIEDKGYLNLVLSGSVSDEEKQRFVRLIKDRYAAPELEAIRKRLILARAVQDGYQRLVKFLCGNVDPFCSDASQNKIIQLVQIYKYVFNLTVQVWLECRRPGFDTSDQENKRFDSLLSPTWQWVLCSICRSMEGESGKENMLILAESLCYKFESVVPGSMLDDYFLFSSGGMEGVGARLRSEIDQYVRRVEGRERLNGTGGGKSAVSMLLDETDFRVIYVFVSENISSGLIRIKGIECLKNLAKTPLEKLMLISLELYYLVSVPDEAGGVGWVKRVETLISEAERSPEYEYWKGWILYLKGVHLLNSNKWEEALSCFRGARKSCKEYCYGDLRGRIARDALALELAIGRLVADNHQVWYRDMLEYEMVETENVLGLQGEPWLEEVAREVSEYFYTELYRPYSFLKGRNSSSGDAVSQALGEFLKCLVNGGVKRWISVNKKLFKQKMKSCQGEPLLVALLKSREVIMMVGAGLDIFSVRKNLDLNQGANGVLVERWRTAVIRVVQSLAKDQLNMVDFKKQTALMLAVDANELDIVKALLEKGADPNMQDYRGCCALTAAIKNPANDCIDALLAHPEIRLDLRQFKDLATPLQMAIALANKSALRKLLSYEPGLLDQNMVGIGGRDSQFSLPREEDMLAISPLEFAKFMLNPPSSIRGNGLNEEELKERGFDLSREARQEIVDILEEAEAQRGG